jgi:hypothetical protein
VRCADEPRVSGNWPLILIEGVLVFGGALLFGWWQLRSVARDQALTRQQREREAAEDQTPGKDRDESDGPPA